MPFHRQEQLKLELKTGPARLPVDLNIVKAQANETDEFVDDDPLFVQYLSTAVEWVEQFTGRSMISRTYSMWLDEWPRTIMRAPATRSDWWDGVRQGAISEIPFGRTYIEIPRPPCQQINAVRTYDDSDVSTTFASSNYFLDQHQNPARLVLRNNSVTPDPQRVANGIEIEFVAGYGDDPHDVPEQMRQACAMLTALLYENRGDCPMEMAIERSGAAQILAGLKIRRL